MSAKNKVKKISRYLQRDTYWHRCKLNMKASSPLRVSSPLPSAGPFCSQWRRTRFPWTQRLPGSIYAGCASHCRNRNLFQVFHWGLPVFRIDYRISCIHIHKSASSAPHGLEWILIYKCTLQEMYQQNRRKTVLSLSIENLTTFIRFAKNIFVQPLNRIYYLSAKIVRGNLPIRQ